MNTIEISNFSNLPAGENSTQSAYISKFEGCIDYEILSRNKELEYIDFLDLSSAVKILGEFFDVNAVVITKESHICSVALGTTGDTALEKAIDCDPISINEGCVGFSKEVSFEAAKLLSTLKIKTIVSPSFSKDAFSYLLDTNINIVKINTPLHELLGFEAKDIKVTPFGILIQDQNNSKLSKESFNVVTKNKPTQEQAEDGIFAWKISKHLTSKSAIIAKDLSAKAIIQGKTNGVIAAEDAIDAACENSKDAVLVIDGVIDNNAVINAAIQGRIGLIIEAGDHKNSAQIIKLADKYNLSMIHTKIRNNKY